MHCISRIVKVSKQTNRLFSTEFNCNFLFTNNLADKNHSLNSICKHLLCRKLTLNQHFFSCYLSNIFYLIYSGSSWALGRHAGHALCTWISWIFQCYWSEIYTYYNGSHSFPCLGCKFWFFAVQIKSFTEPFYGITAISVITLGLV